MKENNKRPPRIAEYILILLLSSRELYRLGDYEEIFQHIAENESKVKAYRWYWLHTIRSIPGLIKNRIYWSMAMFNNYFKMAIRNINKHKVFSFINIFGLAVGMACCILMFLWVQDELSWDRFHENGNDIYRVIAEQQSKDQIIQNARTPDPLLPALLQDYPEIIDAIRFQGFSGWNVRYENKVFSNDDLGTADPSFFKMFSFPFIKGDPETALQDRYSIVITEDMARKYFGNDEPMGKVIDIGTEYTVTGVIKNLPSNSHLHFDCIFPIINMERAWDEDFEDWNRIVFYTYIQIQENSSGEEVSHKIAGVVKNHFPQSNINKIFLQPLTDVHLYSDFQWDLDNFGQGDISYVYIFALTAICILLVACINFMNLYTARSSNRAKEVGMKKVIGAHRKDIIKQFLGESIFISLISLLVAVFVTFLFLPIFNNLSGKELILDFKSNLQLIIGLTLITLLTGIIAGSYPALFLSSFKPANIFRGSMKTGRKTSSMLRKILITVQFTFTIILIIGTTVVYNQLNFISTKNLGFDKDYLLYFESDHLESYFEAAKNELLQNPDILNMSISRPPNGKPWASTNFDWEGKKPEEKIVMYPYTVDYDYIKTFNMEMAEGRFFEREFSTDTSNFVINEAAVKAIGFKSPVGKRFSQGEQRGKIIGVIKDFHQSSLHSEIEPLVLSIGEGSPYISMKLSSNNIPGTIKFIESYWNKFAYGQPFTYEFLDEAINNYYKTEQNIGLVFRYFTILIIFISCLGLFSLASFMTVQRSKEIGIRKVMGASVSGIVFMLSNEFSRWVLLANIFAWPIAYFAISNWLQDFAYHIDLDVSIFLISGILSFLLSLFTVGYQALKAATANPVESLKYE